jgi:hypothetical protein
VALLLVMLLIVSASTFIFLKKLNQQSQQSYQDKVSVVSLARAKEALLGYAAAYPEMASNPPADTGPGYLPCPDKPADDTDPAKVGVSTPSCAISTGSSLGRLPFRTLGVTDLRDSSGERLWYAVSDNFRYNPQTKPINSETPGDLTVDGQSDIVAVIFAPGPALAGQSRSTNPTQPAYSDVTAYLDGTNANIAARTFTSIRSDTMNDRLVTITRQELMAAVEKRVMGEVAKAMQAYRTGNGTNPPGSGSYPWLTPYADPKVMTPSLTGMATAGGGLVLTDSSKKFTALGVAANDMIRDITDGSAGRIASVTATTITATSLSGGATNQFAANDSYLVIPLSASSIPSRYNGTATAGSSGLTLSDTSKDFNDSAVMIGDVIDDVTDGSHGVINAVNNTTLTVQSLQGGAANNFNPNDSYFIRTDTAVVPTGGGSTTTITNPPSPPPSPNYNRMGIVSGEVVQNTTDGSFGQVSAATTSTLTLTTTGVYYGQANTFGNGNVYRMVRYNPNSNVNAREGLLPLQETGKPFRSSFTSTWTFTAGANPATTVNAYFPYPTAVPTANIETNYAAAAANFALSSSVYGSINITDTYGACIWTSSSEAECKGRQPAAPFISGTAGAGSGPNMLTDASRVFDSNSATPDWGVRAGAKINDTTTGVSGIVTATFSSGSGSQNKITTTNNFNAGDSYNIHVPTRQKSGTMSTDMSLGTPYIILNPADPLLTQTVSNDSIQDTSTGTMGRFTNFVSCASVFGGACPSNSYFLIASFTVNAGDSFIIRSGFVSKREYQLQVRHRCVPIPPATTCATTNYVNGERLRTVVTSTTPTINGVVAAPVESVLGTTPVIHIIDRDDTNAILADTTLRIDNTVNGAMTTSGIRYPLLADGTTNALPTWFIPNRWQRTMYVAEAAGFVPGGAGTCTPGTDCLTVTNTDTGANQNSMQAIVISAGSALSTQDRSIGCQPTSCNVDLLQKYLENQNPNTAGGDARFKTGSATSSFNDQIRVVAP